MFELKIKNGDRVKLKSGGPTMTVSHATDDKVDCSWFVDGIIQHGSFTLDSLKAFQGKNPNKAIRQNA